MLESKIQSNIIKKLKEAGIYAHKNIVTNRKGVPDIVCCVEGKYVALEVKAIGGKPTELQEFNIKMIRQAGGVAEVVYSWADVAEILRRMK